MSVTTLAMLSVAAVLGGGLNSVAGGGSFFTFPALLVAGVPSVTANATSTVALWPGWLGSIYAYRRELAEDKATLRQLGAVSLLGGLLGSLLLLLTPERLFTSAVPFLLLLAAAVFTFGDRIRKAFIGHRALPRGGLLALQFGLATYGGYFGGGLGMMMLAAFTFAGMTDLHRMNALKSALGALLNAVGVVTFALAGKVHWHAALVMTAGALVGGFAGAALARRLQAQIVRPFVIACAWAITATFFYSTF